VQDSIAGPAAGALLAAACADLPAWPLTTCPALTCQPGHDLPPHPGHGWPGRQLEALASSMVSSAAGSASRRSSGIGSPLRTERP